MSATVVSVAGSLAADALLVTVATALVPSIRGFAHFRFSDYGSLTVVGVAAAGAGWLLVVRLSTAPRTLYLRAAVVVTVVLWLPDVVILLRGEPAKAVAVLMVMHLAIAVVTYQSMVRLAPPIATNRSSAWAWLSVDHPGPWLAMECLVLADSVVGVVCLAVVPLHRPTGWIPPTATLLYVVHAVIGAALAACGLALVSVAAARRDRPKLVCAVIGLAGLTLAGAGGLLSIFHGLRVDGIIVMFVGAFVALVGYLMPAAEDLVKDPPANGV